MPALAMKTPPQRANVRGPDTGNEVPMPEQDYPDGWPECACGCGEPAPIIQRTDRKRGLVAGQPRKYRHGHNATSSREASAPADRFWPKVVKGAEPDACWVWIGARSGIGYGRFHVRQDAHKYKNVFAHRFAYELLIGPIPEGLEIDHLCNNPPCVNPAHLQAVTPTENKARSYSPPANNARKTRCKHGHPLSGHNLILKPDGYRRCRACKAREDREYLANKAKRRDIASRKLADQQGRD